MIVDFKPEHILAIRYQRGQKGGAQSREQAEAMALSYCAYTAFARGNPQPLICAGITELWPGRAMAWASLDFEAGKVLFDATRRTRAELDRAPFQRIEMYVRTGFAEAWRWAGMLGFELESCMRRGAPDGSNLLVMTRFKHSRVFKDLTCSSDLSPSHSRLSAQPALSSAG